MVDFTKFLEKMGNFMGAGVPKTAGGVSQYKPVQKGSSLKPKSSSGKGFDINLYFDALNNFVSDFFGKKIPYFFKNMGSVLQDFPGWFSSMPQDEQITYVVILLGNLMIVTGFVLFIVL